jgi:hypothetical protein
MAAEEFAGLIVEVHRALPENLIVTDRVREARRIIAEKRGIPANRPLFEMGTAWRQEYTSEMELEEQGVNLGAPENQQLRAAANEVEKFWKGHLNQSPSEDATDTALVLFRQLLSALRASTVPASSSVNTAAWSGSPGACLNACCRSGLLPSGALKRTTYSGRVSSALPSASSAGANWPKTATSRSPDATCTRAPPRRTPEGAGLSRAGSHATRRLVRRSLLRMRP